MKYLILLLLLVMTGCCCGRPCKAAEKTEDDLFYDLSDKLGVGTRNDTNGIELPPPKEYKPFSISIPGDDIPGEVVDLESIPATYIVTYIVTDIERPEEIPGIDLFRAPLQPALGKLPLTISVGNTVKSINNGRLQTREEALEPYIQCRLLGDSRLQEFEDDPRPSKTYKADLAALKLKIAAEIRAEQKAKLGLSSPSTPNTSGFRPSALHYDAVQNCVPVVCDTGDSPSFPGT